MNRMSHRPHRSPHRSPRTRRPSRAPLLAAAVCAALGAGLLPATDLARPAQAAQADVQTRETSGWALAEQFHSLARVWLQAATAEDQEPLVRAAALLKQAAELAPEEPRHVWLLSDVALRLGDRDLAVSALERYRALDRDDEVVAVRYIDLIVDQRQDAAAKLGYLAQVAGAEAVPAGVRSQALVTASDLHARRGDDAAARAALDEALALDDRNVRALQRRLGQVQRRGDPAATMGATIDLLAANVAQPAVMVYAGEQLASAGLVDEATQWYRRGLQTALRMQLRAVESDYVDYASLLLLNDEGQEAAGAVSPLLEAQPDHLDALLLSLLARRQAGGETGPGTPGFDAAVEAVTAKLNALSALAGGADVPENPRRDTLPDVVADANALVNGGDAALTRAYVDALSELVVLDVFFAERAPEQAVIDAVRTVRGEADPLTARVQGWAALRDGQADRAKLKLSAAADRDPLAELGLLMLRDDVARDEAEAFLGGLPTGVLKAMAYDALRDTGARVPRTDDAAALIEQVNRLPEDAVDLADGSIQAEDLYTLTMEPVQVSHEFGEPMLVRVTLSNGGELPLTLGPGGLVRDDLRFDANVAGQALVQDVARASLGGKLRLDPRESVSRVVRVDAGKLRQVLEANPLAPVTLFISGFTNPIELAGGGSLPGPAGQRRTMRKPLERGGTPLANPQQQQALFEQLKRGGGAEKVRAVETIATLIGLLRAGDVDDQANGVSDLRRKLERARDFEQDESVKAMAGWALATLVEDPEDRRRQVQALVSSNSPARRMAGAVVAGQLPAEERQTALSALADGEGAASEYAASLLRQPTPELTEAVGDGVGGVGQAPAR